jgi:hypothetical protein
MRAKSLGSASALYGWLLGFWHLNRASEVENELTPGNMRLTRPIRCRRFVHEDESSQACNALFGLYHATAQLSHVKTLVSVIAHMTDVDQVWLVADLSSDGTPSWGLESGAMSRVRHAQLAVACESWGAHQY